MRHIVVMMVEHVREHERGAGQPWQRAQRRDVGLHDEVAIALVPARGRIARHRLHVDVVGEQIVAAVRLFMRAVEEIFGLEALADEAPLHVDHGDDHGIDRARRDRLLQFGECQISRHQCPTVSLMLSSMMSSARAISVSVVTKGGVSVSTLPKVVLNESPFSSARYITASAAALAGALVTREVTSSIPSR